MDSANESSSKINLVENPQPSLLKRTRKYLKNPRFVFFSLLILVTILVSSIFLSSLLRKDTFQAFDDYLSHTKKYYCNQTPHRRLCYQSISSIINATAVRSNPGLIFSASLQVSINQLNYSSVTIAKALSSTTNNSKSDSSLRNCKAWITDSLSQLNKSLNELGVDSDMQSLTDVGWNSIRSSSMAARAEALNCYRALREVEVRAEGEEKMGVEEVILGVWKASKDISNSQGLFDNIDYILFDYYNPVFEEDYPVYSYFYYHNFNYTFLICMYSALYLFLALLYFLVWRNK